MLKVYDPHLWLRLWVQYQQRKALAARQTVNTRIAVCAAQVESLIAERPALKAAASKLKGKRARLRAAAKGVPQTELLDEVSVFDEKLDTQLSDAEQFLLKKAYRYACMLHHPDRGGDPAVFASLHAAYVAKDLRAVQEFVLHMDRSLVDQAAYWLTEQQRPELHWQAFCRTALGHVAIEIQRGRGEQVVPALLKWMEIEALHVDAMIINTVALHSVGDDE